MAGKNPTPGMGIPLQLAAPSWVIPGTIAENCAFLQNKVAEVALLFMEVKSCLAYTRADLPPELAALGLSFHVHLPADLPWENGGEAVAGICLGLMDKVAFAGARRAVLHPPFPGDVPCGSALEAFAKTWRGNGRELPDVLLENTRENDLSGLKSFFGHGGFGLCPDLGHILAYGQTATLALLEALPPEAAPRMLHCNAPGSGLPGEPAKSAHLPLDTLDAAGRALGRRLCSLLAEGGVVVAELFDWSHIVRSLPVLAEWTAARNSDDEVA